MGKEKVKPRVVRRGSVTFTTKDGNGASIEDACNEAVNKAVSDHFNNKPPSCAAPVHLDVFCAQMNEPQAYYACVFYKFVTDAENMITFLVYSEFHRQFQRRLGLAPTYAIFADTPFGNALVVNWGRYMSSERVLAKVLAGLNKEEGGKTKEKPPARCSCMGRV